MRDIISHSKIMTSSQKRARASVWLRTLAITGFLGLTILGGSAWLVIFLGRWLQFTETPQPSDIIVALAGNPERAIKAAELYQKGFAPEIWISRPSREPWLKSLDRIGIALPSEEQLFRSVLLNLKVPDSSIHFYGKDILSTAEEALCLREAFGNQKIRILLVSHRTHLRRAKMIFYDALPAVRIRAVACDGEIFEAHWWKNKFLASEVVNEIIRMAYYKIGGRFISHPHR